MQSLLMRIKPELVFLVYFHAQIVSDVSSHYFWSIYIPVFVISAGVVYVLCIWLFLACFGVLNELTFE